jgi:hypothetical protein
MSMMTLIPKSAAAAARASKSRRSFAADFLGFVVT